MRMNSSMSGLGRLLAGPVLLLVAALTACGGGGGSAGASAAGEWRWWVLRGLRRWLSRLLMQMAML